MHAMIVLLNSRARVRNPSRDREIMRPARGGLLAWILPLLLGACAGLPRDAAMPINDPNEDMNRHVMAANQEVLRPVSEVVKTAIPGPVHDRLRDLNANVKEPR